MLEKSKKWFFIYIVLFVLLVISVILGLNGYYFSVAYLNSNTKFIVGDDVVVNIIPNETVVRSFTFDGSFLQDEKISQLVELSLQNVDKDLYTRVKVEILDGDNVKGLNFIPNDSFEKIGDYYYSKEEIRAGSKITFCKNIMIPKELNLFGKEKYIINFIVESICGYENMTNVWKK